MQDIISKKNIGERLRSLRLGKDLSQAEVSEVLGLSRSHYSQVELGKQFPSYSVLSRVAEFYNKDYEWILHGTDVKTVITNVKSVLDAEKQSGILPSFNSSRSNHQPAAGIAGGEKNVLLKLSEYLTYLERRTDGDYIAELPEFTLPLSQLSSGEYRAFEVEGDSMEGVLYAQDLAVGSGVENYGKVSLSNIYVIVLDRSISVRRITDFDPESRSFCCVPDNKRYRSEWIAVEDIRELWEIKARISCRLNKAIENVSQYFSDFESTVNELRDEVFRMKSKHL